MTSSPESEAGLARIAEQLRALSNNGLQFTQDPYQIERFHKILALAADLLSMRAAQSSGEIQRAFFDDIALKTPLSTVDTAVFDPEGRLLLIQRADDKRWALPGGACDVGESPAEGARREVWEETGYRVRITHFLGAFDGNQLHQPTSRHLYHLLFAGEVNGGAPQTSLESLVINWFAPDAIPWEALSPGHAPRIRHALAWYADPAATVAYFDPPGEA